VSAKQKIATSIDVPATSPIQVRYRSRRAVNVASGVTMAVGLRMRELRFS
jgi:hypothetical protein